MMTRQKTAVAGVLMLTAAVWAAPVEPPAPAVPEPDAAAEEPRHGVPLLLEFRPQTLQFNSHVSFNEAGVVQHQHQQCTLSVQAFYNPLASPVGYRDAKVKRVITDAGEELAIPDNQSQHSYFNSDRQQQRPRFYFSVQLPYPPHTARAFAEITGSVVVQIGVGPVKEATLPKMKDVDGRRVRIEGLASDVGVSVRRDDRNNRLVIEMAARAHAMLASVKLLSAAGGEIPLQDGGRGSSSTTVTRYYQVAAPDDAQLVLGFYNKLDEIEAPFTLRDLNLPGVQARGGEVVVQAEVPRARRAAAPKGAAEAPALPGELRAVVE